MFEGILEKVLGRVLGQFIEGFDKSNLSVSVWSGNVIIENVKVNPKVFLEMGLPFLVTSSRVGRLKVQVPWKSIRSQSTVIEIEDIEVMVETQQEQHWAIDSLSSLTSKLEEMSAFNDTYKQMILDKVNGQKGDSYASGLVMDILENMQIKVSKVRVQLQHQSFSMGVQLDSLMVGNQEQSKDKDITDKGLKVECLRVFLD